MKPIERKWNGGGWELIGPCLTLRHVFGGFYDVSPDSHFLPLTIRYDNGQLCTFRRKTKGQNNER